MFKWWGARPRRAAGLEEGDRCPRAHPADVDSADLGAGRERPGGAGEQQPHDEHGSHDPQTDVTGDDPVVAGKIALAHMKEFPDYYERLARMEREAEAEWSQRRA